jgi:hypothetical protein
MMSQSFQQQQPQQPANTFAPSHPGYVSTGIGSTSIDMQITFADGERVLPRYIVHHLGIEEIEKMRPELAGVTYGSFVSGFHHEVAAEGVKQTFGAFVHGHFDRLAQAPQNRFKPGR